MDSVEAGSLVFQAQERERSKALFLFNFPQRKKEPYAPERYSPKRPPPLPRAYLLSYEQQDGSLLSPSFAEVSSFIPPSAGFAISDLFFFLQSNFSFFVRKRSILLFPPPPTEKVKANVFSPLSYIGLGRRHAFLPPLSVSARAKNYRDLLFYEFLFLPSFPRRTETAAGFLSPPRFAITFILNGLSVLLFPPPFSPPLMVEDGAVLSPHPSSACIMRFGEGCGTFLNHPSLPPSLFITMQEPLFFISGLSVV